jgi:hypothetical protein
MNAASIKTTLLQIASTVQTWCIWWAKLVIAIGLAYAATKAFSLGWASIEGIRIPIPKVTAEPLQLLYMAAAVWALK